MAKVSVIMSVYNEKLEWIVESITSILTQTYTDFEFIIVIDNPSIDNKCMEYITKKSYQDNRIIIIENDKNLGLPGALNRGISIANGLYIARMDADDISRKDRLQIEIEYLENNNVDLVSSNKINIDEKGQIISIDPPIERDPNIYLAFGNFIIHSSVLVKRDALVSVQGYRELPNSEDFDLWLRLIENGAKLSIVEEPLIKYRIRKNSASIGRGLEQFYVTEYVLKLYRQRKKYKYDNFSPNNVQTYLKKRNICKAKQNNYTRANTYLEHALKSKSEKKWLRLLYWYFRTMITFEPLARRALANNAQKMIIHRIYED